jgi:hypothetical protein
MFIRMGIDMKGNGSIIRNMDKEAIIIKMEIFTQDLGMKTKNMDMGNFFTKRETDI